MVNSIDPYTQRERGPSPGLTVLRDIGAAFKRGCMRSGQAQSQAMIWLAVIAGILILGASAIGLYWLFIRGSEDQALKNNIDRVTASAETYWQQFSADRHGRRDIDLSEICEYANAEFAVGEDLVLRTLAVVDDGTTAVATASAAPDTEIDPDGMADRMAIRAASLTDADANCATAPVPAAGNFTVAGVDIIVSGADFTVAAPYAGDADIDADALINAGLMSTNTVWMSQMAFDEATGAMPGAGEVPRGTRSSNNKSNDVLVFGGVSPSGTSFCVIKVLSASDRGQIGEYRVARAASDDVTTPFAVCSEGLGGAGANTPRINAGWPEAR